MIADSGLHRWRYAPFALNPGKPLKRELAGAHCFQVIPAFREGAREPLAALAKPSVPTFHMRCAGSYRVRLVHNGRLRDRCELSGAVALSAFFGLWVDLYSLAVVCPIRQTGINRPDVHRLLWQPHIGANRFFFRLHETIATLLTLIRLKPRPSVESGVHSFDPAVVTRHVAISLDRTRQRPDGDFRQPVRLRLVRISAPVSIGVVAGVLYPYAFIIRIPYECQRFRTRNFLQFVAGVRIIKACPRKHCRPKSGHSSSKWENGADPKAVTRGRPT
jgi:hypothetical protein